MQETKGRRAVVRWAWAWGSLGLSLVAVGAAVVWPLRATGPNDGNEEGRQQKPRSLPPCADCNVILVSIDTLRADHLGTYGYWRPTSPALDALAERGVVFERAYSASFVTADAHMSMFTSVFPSVHGVKNAVPEERVAHRLPAELSTLPQWLHEAGYATAGFTSGGNVAGTYGFDRGMDSYVVHTDTATGVARTLSFARTHAQEGRRFFVFLHTYEAHDPYLPPAEIASLFYEPYMGDIPRSREELLEREPDLGFERQREAYWQPVDRLSESDRRQLVSAYDAEIRSVDEALARLWDQLDALGRTLLVVTSDHGEQFGEHGGFLHNDLYDELLHVPLIVVHPDGPRGERVGVPVGTMDIAPTVMQLVGLPVPDQAQGRSLAPLSALSERPVLAEKDGAGQALVDGYDKLIARPREPVELYDLESDPDEAQNQSAAHAAARRKLQAQLDTLRGANEAKRARLTAERGDEPHVLDDALAQQLRALGYGE